MPPSLATEKSPTALAAARTRAHVPWCDDYERMVSGMLYQPHARELVDARARARVFMHAYNGTNAAAADPGLSERREEMLRGILGRVGAGAFIEPLFQFDYGCNISLGVCFYANFGLTILDCAQVTIGDRVMFGPNVSLLAATHDVGPQSRRDQIEYALPIAIGNDSWIGAGATVLPGVTIGKGCTIGAGSVVTKDIPDWSVAVGSPARVIRSVEPVPDMAAEDTFLPERV